MHAKVPGNCFNAEFIFRSQDVSPFHRRICDVITETTSDKRITNQG